MTYTRNLLTVRQMSKKHPAWTEPALRWLIFHSKDRKSSKGRIPGNGFAPAIIRMGRKILFDEEKFFEIIDNRNGKAA